MPVLQLLCALLAVSGLLTLQADEMSSDRGRAALYTEILKDYVNEAGMVDYAALKEDPRLRYALEQMRNTDPEALPTRTAKIAFWINVYNAETLKLIADHYPLETIHELHHASNWKIAVVTKTSIWNDKRIRIHGKDYSFFDIDLDILSEKLNEPRIHFALVCASQSCPRLRLEAYTPEKLEAQLNDQVRNFLSDVAKNRFQLGKRKALLSKIFKWYKKDFGRNKEERLRYIAQFIPGKLGKDLAANPEKWSIDYLDYDWDLNDQRDNSDQ